MNVEISVFVICAEAIMYLLLYNLHDCTFKIKESLLISRDKPELNRNEKSLPLCLFD